MWNLITPLLDPVVATKIQFTKSLNDLNQYIDPSALPSFISGDANKKTKDELIKVDAPKAGTLEKPTTAAVQDYEDAIKEYSYETSEWVKKTNAETKDEEPRREHARQLRQARIKAEKDIRGPNQWGAKGMFVITEENRLIIDFGSEGWEPKDITAAV